MAVIDRMPDMAAIRAARGTLDYACTRGTYYVRAWPRKPLRPRSPAVLAAAARFGAQTQLIQHEPAQLRNAEIALTAGTSWTWQDAAMRAAFGKLHRPLL